MDIKTQFGINDKVWLINKEAKKEWEKCEACCGSGLVTLADNKERPCPECYTKGGKTVWLDQEWTVARELTIGQVQATITNIESDGDFCNMGDHKEGGDVYKCQYMAYETGVGSGTCYHEESLFASEQEAQTECDLRNIG
jgi:hypothetical protein